MTKISIAMFSIIAMAGVASAQQAKGSAAAGAKVDAKAATGAVTGAAGAATGAAKVGATAAVKVEMPKPDPQVAATLKAMGARSNCKGTGMGGPDMKTEMKFKGTMTHKSDLDGWWIHDSFNGTMGEGKAAPALTPCRARRNRFRARRTKRDPARGR